MKLVRRTVKYISYFVAVSMITGVVRSDVIFEESFDNQPDYTSSQPLNLAGWTHRRNGEDIWSPMTGYPNHHDAFEVLSSNSDKARGGQGKSFVAWRESYDLGWKNWNSDGILAKHLESGHNQLYVSFWVRFSSKWTKGGLSKMFRMYSWDSSSGQMFQYFNTGFSGPIVLWDYTQNQYGLRNSISLRGGPHGDYYEFNNGDIPGLPRSMSGIGDLSLNYTMDTVGMGHNGETPRLIDKVNGGFISQNLSQTVQHEQIFGDFNEWTKVSFFVKMNSTPNARDGSLVQWINDEIVFQNHNIPWIRGGEATEMVKWNVVAIGGNDYFRTHPNIEEHEEWYAIDDVLIATEIPSGLLPPSRASYPAR